MLYISGPVLDSQNRYPDSLSYGQSWKWGVAGSIELNVFNPDHIDDLFIKPELRHKTIEVNLTSHIATSKEYKYQLRFSALNDVGKIVEQKTMRCNPGQALYSLPWVLAQEWTPESPYLYSMRIELLRNGEIHDIQTLKFGYREFYTKGPFFYLNGKCINLFGDGWHFRQWSEKKIIRLFKQLKKAGINSYRGHGPHPEIWYRIADQMGMLMIAEGPTHQLYRDDINHPDYPANSRRTYTEWVKMIRNHPSLIIYSTDNEVINGYGRGFQEDMPTDRNRQKMMQNLLRLSDIIRQNDDSRPIMYEGDGALDGKADIVNMHYPHEAPFWHLFPQDTLWLKNDPGACEWKYRRWNREKPLYIGEFGKSYDVSPRSIAFFAGDTTYYNTKKYYQAYGEIIQQMILGLRLSDCPGIAPWNTSTYGIIYPKTGKIIKNGIYDGIKAGFRREALFNIDYNTRFFSENTIRRKLALFNDSLQKISYNIRWQLNNTNGTIVANGARRITLNPGMHSIFTIKFKAPKTIDNAEYKFISYLTKKGTELQKVKQTITVFQKSPCSQTDNEILLYDPHDVCRKIFKEAKLKYKAINTIPSNTVPKQVLVIAPETLSSNITNELYNFAATGGHVILLAQKKWPDQWLNLSMPEKPMACTMAFARQPEHSALNSLRESDTKYWATNNIVANSMFYKPASGIMRTIIDSAGNQMGLNYAALLQGRIGNGIITCSQLNITKKLLMEPAAAVILRNLINQPMPSVPVIQTILISKDKQLIQLFNDTSVKIKIDKSFSEIKPTNKFIIIDGKLLRTINQKTITTLKSFVANGATVLFTEMTTNCSENATKLIGTKIELIQQDFFQLELLKPQAFAGLNNDDLCWVVYDEWGCEYRKQGNKRWPIVSNALRTPLLTNGMVIMQTKPVVLGNMYGDALRLKLTDGNFSFSKDNYPALREIPYYKGKFILCQIKLSEGYGKDKVAFSNGTMPWNNYLYSIDDKRRRTAIAIIDYLKGTRK